MSERLICTLRRKSDGKVVEYRDPYDYPDLGNPDNASGAVGYWTDGNFGCDCNRGTAFAGASGEADPGYDCGNGEEIELLKIVTTTGRVLFPEEPPVWARP